MAGGERERIDNPIDATVLDDELQISANVGPATVDTLHVDITAPLDRMGLAGELLTAIRSVAHSRTTDPVTGQRRPVYSTPSSASLDRKSTRLNSSTNAPLVCRLLLEKKNHSCIETQYI